MRSKNSKALTKAEAAHLARVKVCGEDGCNRRLAARGLCATHYMRLRRGGLIPVPVVHSDVDYLAARSRMVGGGCLEWQGSKREGYGRLARRGRTWQAHVLSYVANFGPLPDGAQVNHLCHNRACIEPTHLYAGSQTQNMADMRRAGRDNPPKGERNGNSKITPAIVRAIRASSDIARVEAGKHSISISLVYAVRKRLVWRDISDAE